MCKPILGQDTSLELNFSSHGNFGWRNADELSFYYLTAKAQRTLGISIGYLIDSIRPTRLWDTVPMFFCELEKINILLL